MTKIYEYIRHPRASELARLGRPIKTNDLRAPKSDTFFAKLNAKFGLRITLVVGTMWCAYIFTVLALFALPDAIKQGTYFIIVWLSSSFLQLVLLPIIIVGQNIQAAAVRQAGRGDLQGRRSRAQRSRGDPKAFARPGRSHHRHHGPTGENDW